MTTPAASATMPLVSRSATYAGMLRNRSLRRAIVAFAVFRPAESAQWIALLVYAYRLGGAAQMGLAAVLLLVPAAAFAPFGAQLGDRMHRERALALGYLAQGVATGVTALVLAADLPRGLVYAWAALATTAVTLTRPVHLAILPELARTPEELVAANSLSSTIEGLSIFIGPLLAGGLLAAGGPWAVFAVASGGLTIVGLSILTIHSRRVAGERHVRRVDRVGGALAGFRALRHREGAGVLLGFVAGQTVVIGTATDPYQPAERRFRITRAVLERLARCEGVSVGIITKSRSRSWPGPPGRRSRSFCSRCRESVSRSSTSPPGSCCSEAWTTTSSSGSSGYRRA